MTPQATMTTQTEIWRAQRKVQRHHSAFSVRDLGFWRCYLITMRPYLLFVSGITGLAGLSFAPGLPVWVTGGLAAVFFLSYGFGQALTDCFQVDTDSLSSPYRPLTQGRIGRTAVLRVSLIGLFLCGITLALCSWLNLGMALLAIIGLATYTWFKRRWWGGPFYNAWIVAVLCFMGFIAGGGHVGQAIAAGSPLIFTLAAIFFGYANFVLVGYYKDISADRATGYFTLPVVWGMKKTAFVCDIFALAALLAGGTAIIPMVIVSHFPELLSPIAFFAAAAIASVLAQWRLHILRDEARAHRAIVPVAHAYLLLLSAVITAQKLDWTLSLVLFYLAFIITLKLRPAKQQI